MNVNLNNPNKYLLLAQQALQAQTTSSILQRLSQMNVPVIVLKGQALLGRIYPNLSDRQMGDADLLIKRQDLALAEAILQSEAYVFSDEEWGFNCEFAREFGGEVPYRKGTIVIELHWHTFPLGWYRRLTSMDIEDIWARAIPIKIGEASALRLCPEDEVIHLCCHTAIQHSLIHPHGYRDILGVLRVERDTLDWSVLAERARAWRVSVAVWAALSVARGRMQEARGRMQEARGRMQEARGRMQEARGKRQEARGKNHESRIEHHASRITLHAEELIPESALAALRVPRWRQALLGPFVRRAMSGEAALVSGTMRFLGVLLVDRVRDLPGVVLRGLFPSRRWLQLRYNLSPRQAFWRQFTYPLQVLARGVSALLNVAIRHS